MARAGDGEFIDAVAAMNDHCALGAEFAQHPDERTGCEGLAVGVNVGPCLDLSGMLPQTLLARADEVIE